MGALAGRSVRWSPWVGLADGGHVLEVGWAAATSATVRLWIDGQAGATLAGIDTHASTLETVRLGPSSGLAKTMSGELFFDRFVSSRGSLIGP